MDDKQARLQSRLGPEIREFRDAQQTLQLASVDKQGNPCVSYSPFAYSEQGYFILISDLAQHGQNLKVDPRVSLMMIEDESAAKHIFARRRLSFECQAKAVGREQALWQNGVDALRARFGEMIEQLSQLGDFNLYHLLPQKGRYVKGFGQAFDVSGQEMLDIVHLREGHVKQLKQQLSESS
ncbi:heme utilization protein HutZ [Aliagarivorans marinus]|uniref:heme utilization protein HutZ n=1 Tax=Aliagarivorans marinus TaxID=561965 RepID=UPI00042223D0|nr:heme utilization protein HutZ [Aliagarivorans marinus]